MIMCGVFFFQAEDGIRDLVRSRGLGDVYKRQVSSISLAFWFTTSTGSVKMLPIAPPTAVPTAPGAVSYTHLTLPTSDLV